MTEKYKDKFVVINKQHLLNFAARSERHLQAVHSVLDMFQFIPSTKQKYYVCNQDEPYAKDVLDLILKGEEDKIST